jgi:sugar lactone lactonase YvrE
MIGAVMRSKSIGFIVALVAAAGLGACNTGGSPVPLPPQHLYVVDNSNGHILVYLLPASSAATPSVTVTTGFSNIFDVQFDASGRLFIANNAGPTHILGYTLPLMPASTPSTDITISGTSNAFGFTFTPSGDMWVGDANNHALLGYHPPFSGTSTPTPFSTITLAAVTYNVISDAAGDLYSIDGAHVVRLNAPPTGVNATLSTLTLPIPMLLDPAGNLYVGDFTTGNLYRYNAPIVDGETPAITDLQANTTLGNPYFMALDRAGNLYVADCTSSVKVFTTGTFSSSSAPAYSLPLPAAGNCSGGVAVL